MFTTAALQEQIRKLKKEKDVCILAHSYQSHSITEIADFIGDSFYLSQASSKQKQNNILVCGVRFMAETAKLLSPQKHVFLSAQNASCALAEQISANEIRRMKAEHPDAAVVAYINTTAELKAECDICVTSASAVDIVRKLPEHKVIFVPDCNLGAWVSSQIPEKEFIFIKGGCPVHMRITPEDVNNARILHPNALIAVHPECVREVSSAADYVGSTTGIMNFIKNSDADEFVIGTDNSITEHLQFEYPHKRFFPLSKKCICEDMRLTTLTDIYRALLYGDAEEIFIPSVYESAAKKSIENMLRLG